MTSLNISTYYSYIITLFYALNPITRKYALCWY